ncbi:kinase-like domain-containing protein [Rhizophagus irregularis DAOM 181602=DAOM 197198]|uniref:Kinase-like domain-containing protein n=1 Tax=Rhizophagus irregularis (strain DAOM 181602 / DAOM 197198 / MUCL 43194) TaxID=747089 RepID=A0A2P4PVR7_RHIID|nr:kinase-like domain-containing protein [Rhizophagus irregularis DAOM 181602=DAOM 197198]POG69460.1 kinase-like domain-containing protein [Rhizophagus irregularis DAOM 181602=DAOM 197198]|eukprot:XP_025176326.1 kinase-like domain-containing protein [Rhizophagus irregularis DAOM 181602=DAOM 197198]
METEFSKLNISGGDSNHKNCSYCNKPFTEELWCKECDPFRIMEGWTSGNSVIDKFIKDTMYNFLEWVPFDRFTDIKEIGEGGFAKVYSATWIDGKSYYEEQSDGSWKKTEPISKKIALKRLNGSQNMSDKYLNELKIHWEISNKHGLKFYGLTKCPETKEYMMIIEFAYNGNLRSILSNDFNNIMWVDKISHLYSILVDLRDLHELGYCHKDFHSGNILHASPICISDFGLSGPVNEQKSDGKVYGVMPYIAPEVLNGEPYTSSSDIYSLGVFMAEFSSGKPPFYNKKHDLSLALAICNGLRPEFGKGTPEFYKKLAYKCMNANPNERPTANELYNIFIFWRDSTWGSYGEVENFGYKGNEIKAAFEEANKEIPNISTSYEKNSDAVFTSRAFTFSNLLPKPVNSSIITSYVNNEVCDSQLIDLEVSNSIQLRDIDDESKVDDLVN